ncbi:hypothetical protein [Lutibacter sp.]|uniref:hypothetical protein n=1 Tax=Lutibacter sp. TaxID=1925666 RepID=UPI0027330A1B|nr:hypothetical protein [Lutibacter sp.]MDP3313644.1 hypothetical protein [Lutibacter sp.]
MKNSLSIVVLLLSFYGFSQKRAMYNFNVNWTLAYNDNFNIASALNNEEDNTFFVAGAFFFRNGVDVEINNFMTIGANIGLDWHPNINLLAIPYYLDTKVAISHVDDDKFYVEVGIGKLLKLGSNFENGDYYKIGLGYNIATGQNFGIVLSTAFHQKKIKNMVNGRLNSFSIGLGIIFL